MNNTSFYNEGNKLKALTAIRKKLIGQKLNYKEIYAIMDEIANKRLGDVLTTYFTASGYSNGFTKKELYYLTKAMVETGKKLEFKGIVADKHSIGGVPGTRTTLIITPIVASAGFKIPKSSSRAITTSSGTADDMEVLSNVSFSKNEIYSIVKKTNGCIVWGGGLDIAPADDVIIKVEEPLLFESYDKILISIMAKKIAFGSNHIVIDLPYGEMVKVHRLKDAEILKNKFEELAKMFKIKIEVLIHKTDQPAGFGIGPILETREAIRVLQQKENRATDLEVRSLHLAGHLLKLCLKDSPKKLQKEIKQKYGNATGWATHLLASGKAFEKMKEIIKAQGGNPNIDSEDLKPGHHKFRFLAEKNGIISKLNSHNITLIAKILGAPQQKGAGIFLNKKLGEKVKRKEEVFMLYSESLAKLKIAKRAIKDFPFLEIKK